MQSSFFKIAILGVLITAVGCSSSSKKVEVKREKASVKAPDSITSKRLSITDIEGKLETLSKDVIAKGGKELQYLADDLFFKATDASMRGDSQTAAFLYKFLVKLKPKDLYVKKKYAVELIRIGKINEALPFMEEVFAGDPKDEAVGLLLGGVYTAIDQEKKAQRTYAHVLKEHPKSEEACIFLAKNYVSSKKYTRLKTHMYRCQKQDPKNAIYPYYLGKVSLTLKQTKRAIGHFKKALKVDPKFYQAAIALGNYYEQIGKIVTAQKLYERFLKKNKYNKAVLEHYVQLLFSMEKFDKIMPYLERLSALDPADLNLKVRLGILYTDQKKFLEAIRVFKDILKDVPGSDKVLYYVGSIYQQLDEYEESITYFSKITPDSPLFHDGNLQIAQNLQTLAVVDDKNFNRFETFVSKNMEKYQPVRVELSVMLASYYESKENYALAIKTLKGVEKEGEFKDSHNYFLASLHEKNSEFPMARTIMEGLIAKNPKNAHALNFLGYSLLDRNIELDKAYEYISKAVEIKPKDGYIRDSLGWYYYKVGQFKKALYHLKKARDLVATDHVINKHIAMIYEKLNQNDKAIRYYAEAIKYCQTKEEKLEMQKTLELLRGRRLPASK